jgi:uncharacterized protein YicC (UPF0701 family)
LKKVEEDMYKVFSGQLIYKDPIIDDLKKIINAESEQQLPDSSLSQFDAFLDAATDTLNGVQSQGSGKLDINDINAQINQLTDLSKASKNGEVPKALEDTYNDYVKNLNPADFSGDIHNYDSLSSAQKEKALSDRYLREFKNDNLASLPDLLTLSSVLSNPEMSNDELSKETLENFKENAQAALDAYMSSPRELHVIYMDTLNYIEEQVFSKFEEVIGLRDGMYQSIASVVSTINSSPAIQYAQDCKTNADNLMDNLNTTQIIENNLGYVASTFPTGNGPESIQFANLAERRLRAFATSIFAVKHLDCSPIGDTTSISYHLFVAVNANYLALEALYTKGLAKAVLNLNEVKVEGKNLTAILYNEQVTAIERSIGILHLQATSLLAHSYGANILQEMYRAIIPIAQLEIEITNARGELNATILGMAQANSDTANAAMNIASQILSTATSKIEEGRELVRKGNKCLEACDEDCDPTPCEEMIRQGNKLINDWTPVKDKANELIPKIAEYITRFESHVSADTAALELGQKHSSLNCTDKAPLPADALTEEPLSANVTDRANLVRKYNQIQNSVGTKMMTAMKAPTSRPPYIEEEIVFLGTLDDYNLIAWRSLIDHLNTLWELYLKLLSATPTDAEDEAKIAKKKCGGLAQAPCLNTLADGSSTIESVKAPYEKSASLASNGSSLSGSTLSLASLGQGAAEKDSQGAAEKDSSGTDVGNNDKSAVSTALRTDDNNLAIGGGAVYNDRRSLSGNDLQIDP